MDCKEAQKAIPEYLANEMELRTEEQFLDHVENCISCKEELCIQYLVLEETARLENGSSFDLNKELEHKMSESRKIIKKRRIGTWIIYILEFMAILAVMFILFLVFNK